MASFLADRLLKFIFMKKIPSGEFFVFLDLIRLKLAQNSGIAFGLPLPWPLIIALYAIIIFILFWLLTDSWSRRNYPKIFAWQLVLGGAFSNLFDRLRFGQVIDYIDVKYYSVFNLADVMIIGGIILLLALDILRDKKLPDQNSNS